MVKVKTSGSFKNTETYLLNHRKSMFTESDIITFDNRIRKEKILGITKLKKKKINTLYILIMIIFKMD